jgi:hypothetical protein
VEITIEPRSTVNPAQQRWAREVRRRYGRDRVTIRRGFSREDQEWALSSASELDHEVLDDTWGRAGAVISGARTFGVCFETRGGRSPWNGPWYVPSHQDPRRQALGGNAFRFVEGLELQLHVAPVLFGGGIRLFANVEAARVGLEVMRVVETPAATHLRYRVLVTLVRAALAVAVVAVAAGCGDEDEPAAERPRATATATPADVCTSVGSGPVAVPTVSRPRGNACQWRQLARGLADRGLRVVLTADAVDSRPPLARVREVTGLNS